MAVCNLSVDASYSAPASMMTPTKSLTFDHINIIEPNLEDYELYSLIFLLYDNVNTAYERLHMIELMKAEGIDMNQLSFSGHIFDWAQAINNQNGDWKNMLLEALCVIQSYALLRKLGFNKQEMIERFLPDNCECSLFLNRVKKVLYRMCENLTPEETKKLISRVNDDLKTKKLPPREIYDAKYLEIYILYWATIGYITISDESIDLTNLLQILKELEMDIFYDQLKSSIIKFENKDDMFVPRGRTDAGGNQNNNTMLSMRSSITDSEAETNNFSIPSNIDHSQIYKMDPNNAGILVIINQINFKNLPYANEVYETRNGTDKDKDRLKEVFGKFGFRIIVHKDLEHREILRKIEDGMRQFKATDCCFIVAILSHGKTGVILSSDCYAVELTEIENCIQNTKFKRLLGKPKILIIQACQGAPKQKEILLPPLTDIESNDSRDIEEEIMNLVYDGPVYSVPEKVDFLEISATVSGFAAIRDQKRGSWFIQTFCKLLEEQAERTHLEDIIISMKYKVTQKRWGTDCMVPESRSTLTKRLFFKTVSSSARIENEKKPL